MRILGSARIERIRPPFHATEFHKRARHAYHAGARRAFDILLELAILVFVSPLMAVVAALVAIESRGPILYRQDRVGLRGSVFTMLKFRSMRVDAEPTGPLWARQNDPRVTRIGGFLRRTHIDELPQLFNVLRGEMSLVGPRPERPHFVALLSTELPSYDKRMSVKPGITGWAQIKYPYAASIEDTDRKLAYDLDYVRRHNVFFDILILVRTMRVVLLQQGSR